MQKDIQGIQEFRHSGFHGKTQQPSKLGVIELIQNSFGEKIKIKQVSQKAWLKKKCLLHMPW